MSLFSGLSADFVKAFEDVKGAVIKAANELPAIEKKIEGVEPEVVALASLVVPNAAAIAQSANTVLEAVAGAISSGGAAAEGNFLSAGLDQATINAVKAVIPAFQAAVGKK